jgi:hypothetical protein
MIRCREGEIERKVYNDMNLNARLVSCVDQIKAVQNGLAVAL